MKIYVASSWRNQQYPAVVKALVGDGHDVYDFRNPPGKTGFSWQQVDGDNAKTIPAYFRALDTDMARAGFASDRHHLEECDALLLVLPCGRSAHLEAGYAAGQGKKVIVLLHEDKFEPELMYLLCDGITDDLGTARAWMMSYNGVRIAREMDAEEATGQDDCAHGPGWLKRR